FELHARRVSAVNAPEVVDAAVGDHVAPGRQPGAVASHDLGGAAPDGVDVATEQRVTQAAEDTDAVACHALNRAAGNKTICTVIEHNAVPACEVEDDAFKACVGEVGAGNHGPAQHGKLDGGVGQIGRRIEIQNSRFAVEIPFA